MSGDYSRQRFDPFNDFSGVLMQQGRVQLDADWNELVDIFERRVRAETTDIMGRATVPRETPDAFAITIAGGIPRIGPGRIYVDGLLAENHGAEGPQEFDTILAEQRGTSPTAYNDQPYFPNVATAAPFPTTGGPHLVYLDVWQREVTYREDPGLEEIAVGVDTTTRYQIVWQVRVLSNVEAGVTCDTLDNGIAGWPDILRPSAGRLSSAAVGVLEDDNLCLTPPTGGFNGLENRLYRVEIHDGGPRAGATFKWSRDNASVATAVTAIPNLINLTVASVGRDAVLRFSAGDWVEITDDWREFAGEPGIIGRIQDVNDATRTIALATALPAGAFPPTDTQGTTEPGRHTRIRRWDQKGRISDTDGNLLVDLYLPGSSGVIPVPADGTSIVLEDGVQVTFNTSPTGGEYHAGDYWVFAARTADASVEELHEAPPRGVHHHYCRLAIVTLPNDVSHCRTIWPPEIEESCSCTVCVTADGHNSGELTIEAAIAQVSGDRGGIVCLAPGQYQIERPIQIMDSQALRVRGSGNATVLLYRGAESAIEVRDVNDVSLERLCVKSGDAVAAISLNNGVSIEIDRVEVDAGERSTAIQLGMITTGVRISNCRLASGLGIAAPEAGTLLGDIHIVDNYISAAVRGISLPDAYHLVQMTEIAQNTIEACHKGGIVISGTCSEGSRVEITRNLLNVVGPGIIAGCSRLRILENDVTGDAKSRGDGVLLVPTADDFALAHLQILANRITKMAGDGIAIECNADDVIVKQNQLSHLRGSGIVMRGAGRAYLASIDNNQIVDAGAGENELPIVGIGLNAVLEAQIQNNAIREIGMETKAEGVGIFALGCSTLQVKGNQLVDLGTDRTESVTAIRIVGPFESSDVNSNTMRYTHERLGVWRGLVIEGMVSTPTVTPGFVMTPFGDSQALALAGFSTGEEGIHWEATNVFEIARGDQMVGVRSNSLTSRGQSAVSVTASGAVVFSDNRCTGEDIPEDAALVDLKAPLGTVAGNYAAFTGGGSDYGLPVEAAEAGNLSLRNGTRIR